MTTSLLRRSMTLLVALGVLLGGTFVNIPAARAAATCFAETGYCIEGRFLAYWQANGGLERNGYPLSAERREVLEDGKEYTVQYFERVRLEYHPENPAPYDVLLGQFGRRVLSEAYAAIHDAPMYQRAIAPVEPIAGQVYFAETGHNLGGRFLAYWQANGGLAQFGYPITEERWDSLATPGGGACCATQYFERARFEYHPENEGTPYVVLLGQFGRQIMAENALLSGDFERRYFADPQLRERLGAPVTPVMQVQAATQPFERGRMFWRADQRRIYVFNGTPESGTLMQEFYGRIYFEDNWTEGQPVGGGPAQTVPGAFVPERGFFKVWRENERVREEIGYATTPREHGYAMQIQEFGGGLLLTCDTVDGTFVYAVLIQRGSHTTMGIAYQRLGK